MDTAGIVFFTIWLVAAVSILRFLYIKGKETLSIFPEIDPGTLRYKCRQGSGSYVTGYGGARNCLEVIVTNNELWIRTNTIFAFIAAKNNLIQKLPLGHINHKEKSGSKVIIDFNSNGGGKRIILKVPNPDAFLAALTL